MKIATTDREEFFISSEQLEEFQWNFQERYDLSGGNADENGGQYPTLGA